MGAKIKKDCVSIKKPVEDPLDRIVKNCYIDLYHMGE